MKEIYLIIFIKYVILLDMLCKSLSKNTANYHRLFLLQIQSCKKINIAIQHNNLNYLGLNILHSMTIARLEI